MVIPDTCTVAPLCCPLSAGASFRHPDGDAGNSGVQWRARQRTQMVPMVESPRSRGARGGASSLRAVRFLELYLFAREGFTQRSRDEGICSVVPFFRVLSQPIKDDISKLALCNSRCKACCKAIYGNCAVTEGVRHSYCITHAKTATIFTSTLIMKRIAVLEIGQNWRSQKHYNQNEAIHKFPPKVQNWKQIAMRIGVAAEAV